jgi:C4-dicarboxylate-specific signal transduction histidine kinase
MGDVSAAIGIDRQWQRQFVSDVYHTLAQPLTALHCSLELALRASPDLDRQRAALEDGLRLTGEVLAAAKFVRRLAEADDPGHPVSVPLGWAIHAVVQELDPVAESMSARIDVPSGCAVRVWIDPQRLREVLFHLFDWVLHSAQGKNVCADVRCGAQWATVNISPAVWTDIGKGMTAGDLSRNLGIAERMVRAAHGELSAQNGEAGTTFALQLPLTEQKGKTF